MNNNEVLLQAINMACLKGVYNLKEAYDLGKIFFEPTQDETMVAKSGDPIPTDPIKPPKGKGG